jgi:hypothetical protein
MSALRAVRVESMAAPCEAAAELTREMVAESAAVFASAAECMAETAVERLAVFVSTDCRSSKRLRS